MKFLHLVAFSTFATSLFTRSVDPIIPQIATAFDVEPATAAILASAFALTYAGVQPVLGALADMVSKTWLMMSCLLLLVIASVAAAVTVSFEMLLITRAVSGVAAGGVFPTALALVGDRVPVAQRQVAFSRVLAGAMMGNLLGASGAGVIADLFGWRAVFVATALVGFIVLLAAAYGFHQHRVPDAVPARFDLSTLGPNYRAIFRNPLAKYCFGSVFLEATFVFGIFPHVASLMAAAGETRAAIAGVVIAGFGIGVISYTLAVSRLLAVISGRTLMLYGGIIMGGCFVVIALQLPWYIAFFNFLLLGFGMYLLHGYVQVLTTELVPAARGTAVALHSAAFFSGQALGPLLYGSGFNALGVQPMLLIAAAILLVVGVVAALMLRRPAQPGAPTPNP